MGIKWRIWYHFIFLLVRMSKLMLKKYTLIFLLLLSSLLPACTANIPSRPDKLGLEEIKYTMPSPIRWQLENGLEIIYFYDDELPQITAQIYFPGGQLYSPFNIAGLAQATGQLMREGSTQGISPDNLDERLDKLAASIESSFGAEYGTVSFSCLIEDFDEIFALFAGIVKNPAFEGSRLALWKTMNAYSIQRRRDNPNIIAALTFKQLLFGQNSPYGEVISLESVARINQEALREFHQLFVHPNGAKLAISGAVPSNIVEAAIKKHFNSWKTLDKAFPKPPIIPTSQAKGVFVLERDFEQTVVMMGHLGPARQSKEQYALSIYNEIFGTSGFGSLLFDEVRTKLGLAYYVGGGFAPSLNTGSFQISLGTRNQEVARAIKASIAIMSKTITELPEQKMFINAKSAEERSFVFNFASPSAIVYRQAVQDILSYPKDYDINYLSNISRVTSQDIQNAAQNWLHPDQLIIVVVGKNSVDKIKKELGDKFQVHSFEFDTQARLRHPDS